MKSALLNGLAAVFLAAIAAVAWSTHGLPPAPVDHPYTVASGDTAPSIAGDADLSLTELAEANASTAASFRPVPGQVIIIPAPKPTLSDEIAIHGAGLAAEIVGVIMSLWLAFFTGLLAKGHRRQIVAISLVLGVASYAADQAGGTRVPAVTPSFLFAALRDGFAWSAAFPMFARALGLRDRSPTDRGAKGPPAAETAPGEGAAGQ
ncbi:MAG: LysM peptidoglycan-binding domain-containing protein [Anaerolineae bacterium]